MIPGRRPTTFPVAFAGYNVLLELEAGQYTIVTGYQSPEDGSYLSTTTVELTVNS